MQIYSRADVNGNNVELHTTHKNHISDKTYGVWENDPEKKFSDVLFEAVDSVNRSQVEADELEKKMIISPDEVNINEVTIAAQKAEMSLTFFKTIMEKAIKAYNEIMTIR